jgi:hypothetical protein
MDGSHATKEPKQVVFPLSLEEWAVSLTSHDCSAEIEMK